MTGGLHLEVMLSNGVVRATRLRSERKASLCRAMRGRRAAEVPAAFEHLYALCGRSHRIAARFSLAAARGIDIPAAARREAVRDLAAERVGEHLRSTFITTAALGFSVTARETAALRAALAATRPEAAGSGLDAALSALGLDGAAPEPDSWAARMLDQVGPAADGAGPVDALSPADDAAVLAGLAGSGAAYAALPSLPLRRPETGPLARRGGSGAARHRLATRFAEIGCAAAVLTSSRRREPGHLTIFHSQVCGTLR